ncbi:MAG: hypothetical protein ACFCGT_27540 [Sandaracinaceae bacterium]
MRLTVAVAVALALTACTDFVDTVMCVPPQVLDDDDRCVDPPSLPDGGLPFDAGRPVDAGR